MLFDLARRIFGCFPSDAERDDARLADTVLGVRDLPRELTEFELQAFFSFSCAELELIERRRGAGQKSASRPESFRTTCYTDALI